MGWRGTLRPLQAASRRHEREQHRKQRLLQQRQQQVAKLDAAQQAAHEVELYENSIDLITSVHRDCGEVWDWEAIQTAAPPPKPEYSNQLETAQRQREAQHQPAFLGSNEGPGGGDGKASERAIQEAKIADQAIHDIALKKYESKLEEWKALQRIARGVLAGEAAAFKEALDELKPFEDIKEIGRNVQMQFTSRHVQAVAHLHGPEIVAREIKTYLKSGTVSKKPASETYLHQTYQKHVCSCELRAARGVAIPEGLRQWSGRLAQSANREQGTADDHLRADSAKHFRDIESGSGRAGGMHAQLCPPDGILKSKGLLARRPPQSPRLRRGRPS